jgi:hypothetical protein
VVETLSVVYPYLGSSSISVQGGTAGHWHNRSRESSKPARPYIWRLSVFSRLI